MNTLRELGKETSVVRATVVTRELLADMAEKCTAASQRRNGMPILDDAAELLEQAAFRVAALEEEVRQWRASADDFVQRMPARAL